MKRKPLEGLRVADFGWILVGPITGKFFADAGADVIKIEGRSRIDLLRTTRPFKDDIPGENRAGDCNQHNTSKRSIALNLAHPKGVEVAKQIVAWSDIVIENFAGGVMERMGLGYGELKKVKPDIIMLSTCMQGQTGPHANHAGFGYHLAALSGFSHITGWPDRPPANIGPYTDFIAPRFNTLAILAAIDYRNRTGKGQYFDMSQYENGVQFMSPLVLDYAANQRIADRMGNGSESAAPHGAYRCRGTDRWCVIAVFGDTDWQRFCRVIGNPTWTEDPKFSTLTGRRKNEAELDKRVEEWTCRYSAETVTELMQTDGVAAGVVETAEDLLEHDPQLKHRRSYREVTHPEIGIYRAPAPPFLFSKADCDVKSAPLLGEHNEDILKKVLEMSDDEIEALVIEGIVE